MALHHDEVPDLQRVRLQISIQAHLRGHCITCKGVQPLVPAPQPVTSLWSCRVLESAKRRCTAQLFLATLFLGAGARGRSKSDVFLTSLSNFDLGFLPPVDCALVDSCCVSKSIHGEVGPRDPKHLKDRNFHQARATADEIADLQPSHHQLSPTFHCREKTEGKFPASGIAAHFRSIPRSRTSDARHIP